VTHPAPTQNQWRAAARAAAAAAPRLARRTRIRHGEPPRKPADIAEWTLGSNLTVPLFCFWVKKFKVFRASAPPRYPPSENSVTMPHALVASAPVVNAPLSPAPSLQTFQSSSWNRCCCVCYCCRRRCVYCCYGGGRRGCIYAATLLLQMLLL
jgi:hypothetical protein